MIDSLLSKVVLEYEDPDLIKYKSTHSSIIQKGGKIYASVKRGPASKKQQEINMREKRNKARREKARKERRRKELSNLFWRFASLFVRGR